MSQGKVDIGPGNNRADVLVVGAGISGIQASLDLAAMGFRVFLVDKSPAIGGKMAQLDKTFPTNDCSMCIESPKFIECNRNPNIEILSYTEVEMVEGEAGDFRVTLLRKPRYIQDEKCRGCTACTEVCPVGVPNQFNQGLSESKCTHIYFSQAVPLVTYIDSENCLYLKDKKCGICEGACKNGAINLDQKPQRIDVFGSDGAYAGTLTGYYLPVGRLPNGELLVPMDDEESGGIVIARMRVTR